MLRDVFCQLCCKENPTSFLRLLGPGKDLNPSLYALFPPLQLITVIFFTIKIFHTFSDFLTSGVTFSLVASDPKKEFFTYPYFRHILHSRIFLHLLAGRGIRMAEWVCG